MSSERQARLNGGILPKKLSKNYQEVGRERYPPMCSMGYLHRWNGVLAPMEWGTCTDGRWGTCTDGRWGTCTDGRGTCTDGMGYLHRWDGVLAPTSFRGKNDGNPYQYELS